MSHKPKQRQTDILGSRLRHCPDTGNLYWKNGPKSGKEAGWSDRHGYKLTRVNGTLLRNHHIVWFFNTGSWPTSEVDHKDNNPSNNLFSNLRMSDRRGQGANQTLQGRRAGKWKGVHQSPSGKFYVKIKSKGKTVTGIPADIENPREAAMIYNTWAEKLFGPFANFNQVFEDIT